MSPLSTRQQPQNDSTSAISFSLPPLPITISVLGGLAMLTFIAITQSDSSLLAMLFSALPQGFFCFLLKTLVSIHFVESIIMFLACSNLRRRKLISLSTSTQAKYTASTLVFGAFSAVELFRQASKIQGDQVCIPYAANENDFATKKLVEKNVARR
ncbi:hypothetical protein BX070DRAFT_77925 [Coemansia spiralis]|nr:hypothetical protein BX070DRAFT_77925 [Coemansia spiralis]